MIDLPRRVMYPKGRVVHYALDSPGFQKVKTLCGKVMDWDYWGFQDDSRGSIPACKTCLKKRHEYT